MAQSGLFGSAYPAAALPPQHGKAFNTVDALLGGWLSVGGKETARQAKEAYDVQQRQQLMQGLNGLFGGASPSAGSGVTPGAPLTPSPAPPGPAPTPAATPRTLRDVLPILGPAVMAGIPGAKDAFDMFDKTSPNIQVANGVTYDARGTPAGQHIGVNGSNVNGTIVDLQDPNNMNRFVPEAPTKGSRPVYDKYTGKQSGWELMDGSAAAIGQSAAAQSGGTEAGRAPFDVMTVPQSDGSNRMMPKAEFLGIGAGGPRMGGPAPGAPRLGVSQSPADAVYNNKGAETAAGRYASIQTAGQTAGRRVSQLQQLNTLLGDFEGGKLAETGVELASALNSMGIQIDKNLGNKQAAASLSAQALLTQMGGSLGPGISNSDVTFMQKTVPGLGQSAGGRRKMVEMGIATAKRDEEVASFASKWASKYGRIDSRDPSGRSFEDSLRVWAAKHPLFAQQ